MKKFLSDRRGFTTMELVVSIGLFGVLLYLIMYFLGSVSKSSNIAALRAQANMSIAEFDKVTNQIVTSVSTATFDPATSYQQGSDGSLQALTPNDRWNLTTILYSPSAHQAANVTVPSLSLGAFHRPKSSFDVDTYRVTANSDGTTSASTELIYLSRCVPVSGGPIMTNHTYDTLAKVDALKRPVILANNQVQCCNISPTVTPPASPFTSCSGLNRYWPTVFVYRGEGLISAMPADSDRKVIPGIGFALAFDANPAGYFHLSMIVMQNQCATGKNMGSKKCVESVLGGQSAAHFDEEFARDVVTQVNVRSGATVSDITGGSFIMLGPTKVNSGP